MCDYPPNMTCIFPVLVGRVSSIMSRQVGELDIGEWAHVCFEFLSVFRACISIFYSHV